jgi:hypothetical protein
LLGAPSSPTPYHCFGLAKFGLTGHRRLLAIAVPGRVLVTTHDSRIGSMCRTLESEPVNGNLSLRRVIRDVEVGQYPVPAAGRRLQVQGAWLAQHGFKPGVRFAVSTSNRELTVRLAADGATTVTEHSPGRSKLYVPAAELAKLDCARVSVRARKGALRVVALDA